MQTVIRNNIAEYGWHTQAVGGDQIWPPFTYTIGWGIERGWPEVIIIGQRAEVAHGILTNLWESNKAPEENQVRQDLLPNFDCKMKHVDLSWYQFLFGAAIDFYMDNDLPPFNALQCVWPTTSGVFPWDDNAPEDFDRAQPLVNAKMVQEPGTG